MGKLISKTYGDAFYDLALEEDKVDGFSEEAAALIEVLRENPELSRLLNHPKIDKEEKLVIVENVFRGRMSDELTGFMKLIITKDRYSQMIPILEYFIERVKALKKIGRAVVTTAVELDGGKKQEIESRLLKTTPYVRMEMDYSVDESLIGGMTIRIGDRVVDTSIRTKLNELSRELYKIQLA